MRLNVDDITGVVGIVPTPAKPGADRWDAQDTVNLRETEKMTEAVVGAGIEVVMTTGTFGECATLTWPELRDFVDCVVQMTRKRAPVFAGITTLNTRDTIERGRALVDLGADGLFVGRPMWLPLDDKGIVQFYRDLAEAMPGVPLVAYDNPLAFKGKISTEAYKQIAAIPEMVASKHVGGPSLEGDLLAVGKGLRLLPLEPDWCALAEKYPELAKACWSGSVACAPAPIAALSKAILARDWPRARALTEKVIWAQQPMFPGGDLATFMRYSIQLGHIRFAAAGLIDPGPTRPPYVGAPEEYVAGSVECGRRWAQLQRELTSSPVGVS
jgi:4-(2-carboxyphenyl)-2-oxobut-3-enoate aldolase